MVLDAVSNFVRGNTDAAVGTSDTTVSVDDASIFPDPATDGEFNVVIWDANNFPRPDQDSDVEIMRVTARDTTADELTVVRGQETTSAAAHPEGSAIHLSPTAKMFSDIESTFGDFWDAGTQELTGDVNNTNTTTQDFEAEEAGRGEGNLWEESSSWTTNSISFREDPDDVSSDTFTDLTQTQDSIGAVVPRLQDGVSLYANFLVRPDSVPSGETGQYRPRVVFRSGSDVGATLPMEELEIEVTDDDDGERIESGWQEITSFNPADWTVIHRARVSGKVTGGTMESGLAEEFHLLFDRRVD